MKAENFMQTNSCSEEVKNEMNLLHISRCQHVKENSQGKSIKDPGRQPSFLLKDNFSVEWCLLTFRFRT